MTIREQMLIRILLFVARLMASDMDERIKRDLQNLTNSLQLNLDRKESDAV